MSLSVSVGVGSVDQSVDSECSTALTASTDQTNIPLLLDGKFFKIVKNNEMVIQAQCTECKKMVKGRLDVTSNFRNHLKVKCHPHLIEEYENYLKTHYVHPRKRTEQSFTVDEPKKKKIKQMKLTTTLSHSDQQKADQLITNFIYQTMSPLVLVEHTAFIDLLKGINELRHPIRILTRKTLSTKIDDDYDKLKKNMKEKLQSLKYVCTTADIWSINRRSFMGVTVHWINSDLKRGSFAIACRRFKGNHTYDKVATLINDINEEFIDKSKTEILKTVTDNGSNMIKAFKTFKSDCNDRQANHSTNNDISLIEQVLSHSDLSRRNAIEIEYEDNDDTIEDEPQLIPITEMLVLPSIHSEIDILLPEHQRCASHTLNLITTVDIKQVATNNPNSLYGRVHNSTFTKCFSIWTLTKKSSKSSEIYQRITNKCPTSPCPTRWNSYYDCILDFLKVREKLNEACESLNLVQFKEIEMDFLTEYVDILRPFAETLDHMQGSKDTYYGELIPNLFRIKRILESLKLRQLKFCNHLNEVLYQSLLNRFREYLTLSSSVNDAILASISHPYFTLKWVSKDNKNRLKQILMNEMVRSSKLRKSSHAAKITEEMNIIPTYLFEDPDTSDSDGNENNTMHLQALQYLQDSDTDLCMLNKYPDVREIFIKFNTPLPSSAAVERLFSYGGMIMRPKRRCLKDDTFEKILLLKANLIKD